MQAAAPVSTNRGTVNASTLSLIVSLGLPALAGAADLTSLVITDPVIIEAAPLPEAGRTAEQSRPLPTAETLDAHVTAGSVTAADIPKARAMRVSEVVLQALSLLGTPYRWGGNSTDAGFDCSGLVKHVVEQALGLVLPRSAIAMSRLGTQVERPRLQPGDLLFFVTRRQDVSHVGIYVGEGRFVHANRHGGEVTLSTLENKYWASRLAVARRVEPQ